MSSPRTSPAPTCPPRPGSSGLSAMHPLSSSPANEQLLALDDHATPSGGVAPGSAVETLVAPPPPRRVPFPSRAGIPRAAQRQPRRSPAAARRLRLRCPQGRCTPTAPRVTTPSRSGSAPAASSASSRRSARSPRLAGSPGRSTCPPRSRWARRSGGTATSLRWTTARRSEVASEGDTRVTTGVEYAARLGFRPLLLDLHLPPGDGPFPVVVFVRGGGGGSAGHPTHDHQPRSTGAGAGPGAPRRVCTGGQRSFHRCDGPQRRSRQTLAPITEDLR